MTLLPCQQHIPRQRAQSHPDSQPQGLASHATSANLKKEVVIDCCHNVAAAGGMRMTVIRSIVPVSDNTWNYADSAMSANIRRISTVRIDGDISLST
jgi:hypothetical protein